MIANMVGFYVDGEGNDRFLLLSWLLVSLDVVSWLVARS
jgi:hypothetical protein